MADPALRQLDQLQADGRTGWMAAVAGAAGAARHRCVPDSPAHPDEGARLMGWAILLLLFVLGLGTLWLFGVRGGLLKAAAAALLLGASGYALQGQPELAGSPAQGSEGSGAVPLTERATPFSATSAARNRGCESQRRW